ncbi:MAG: DUF4406 domain-containing protein [Propionibacteriaceae bacterium]|nr:DUF4406 domain-containing protein [Propionibacteriaceae bacterium]
MTVEVTIDSPALYIAGPITGISDYKAIFDRAWHRLVAAGYQTCDPSFHDPERTPLRRESDDPPTWHDWMRPALSALTRVDGVALLPGWEDSEGASWEKRIAEAVLGIPALPLDDWIKLAGRLPEPDECWKKVQP